MRRAAARWPPARTARPRAPGRRAARPRSRMAATARCANETSRVEVTRTACPAGEIPLDRAPQHAGAQVEHALVAAQLAVADVERLVVDQQADDLAVGHVDQRLARLGVAVAGLRVGQRAHLVEAVQVGARAGRAARPRRGCRAGRCGRWRARTPTRSGRARRGRARSRAAPTARPRSAGCSIMPLEQLGEVLDHDVGAVRAQRVGLARPGRRRRRSRSARRGPPSTPGERVLEHRRLAPARRRAPRAAPGRCPAPACPRRCSRSATTPSMRTSNRSSMPAACSTSRQLVLDETTARAQPGRARRAARSAPSPRRPRRPARGSAAGTISFLRLPRPSTVSASGGSLGVARRQLDPARGEERRARRRSAACRRRTRRSRPPRRTARTARRSGVARSSQVGVEHLLPGRRVHLRRLRQHAVEVEQAPTDLVRQAEHIQSLRNTDTGADGPHQERSNSSGRGRVEDSRPNLRKAGSTPPGSRRPQSTTAVRR